MIRDIIFAAHLIIKLPALCIKTKKKRFMISPKYLWMKFDGEKKKFDESFYVNFLSIHHCRKLFTHRAGGPIRRPSKNLFRGLCISFLLHSASCLAFCCILSTSQFFSAFIFINIFFNFIFSCEALTQNDAPDVISVYPQNKTKYKFSA